MVHHNSVAFKNIFFKAKRVRTGVGLTFRHMDGTCKIPSVAIQKGKEQYFYLSSRKIISHTTASYGIF